MLTGKSSIIRPSYHQNFARSAGESKYPNRWKGLIAAWAPFLGVTGNRLLDQSTKRNHLTINGATWVPGRDGPELFFNGINACVEELGTFLDIFPSEMMWAFSFTPATTISPGVGGSVIMEKINDDTGSLDLLRLQFWNATGDLRGRKCSGGTQVVLPSTTTTWTAGTRYHVAGGYSETTGMSLYINGILENSNADTGAVSDGSQRDFIIGADNFGGVLANYFDGTIGGINIYSRVLPATEVAWLYRNPVAMFQQAIRPIFFVPVVGRISRYHGLNGLGGQGQMTWNPLG